MIPAPTPHIPVDSAESTTGLKNLWRAYQPFIWLFAAASLAMWLPSSAISSLPVIAALIILGNVADLFAIRIQEGMRVSAAHFAAPFAIIATGVGSALIVAACCLVGRLLWNRRDWNTFDIAVNISAASIAGAVWVLTTLPSWSGIVVPSVLTVSLFAIARSLINLGWANDARSRGAKIPAVTVPIGRLMLASAMLFTPAVALYRTEFDNHLSAICLLVLPFIAVQFLIRSFGRERQLNQQLEAANVSLTESLVNALDARDPYSGGHSVAVAVYSRDLASEIGLDADTQQRIYLAGLLHDIGKIAVPDAILRKPAALTDEEFDEIRKHPVVGEEILSPSQHLQDLLPGIRHHHERIDGKGYPDRLRDENIPLQARIIAVADAYNAMTSNRPYRDAMTSELAQRVLVQNQGMQHDPYMVTAFVQLLARRGHSYRYAQSEEFATSMRLREILDEGYERLSDAA